MGANFFALFLLQTSPQGITQREPAETEPVGNKISNPRVSKRTRSLFPNDNTNVTKNYISAHHLRSVAKNLKRPRIELVRNRKVNSAFFRLMTYLFLRYLLTYW